MMNPKIVKKVLTVTRSQKNVAFQMELSQCSWSKNQFKINKLQTDEEKASLIKAYPNYYPSFMSK